MIDNSILNMNDDLDEILVFWKLQIQFRSKFLYTQSLN